MDKAGRKRLIRLAGWTTAIVVILFVGRKVGADLRDLAQQPMPAHPVWGFIALSGILFLLAHAVLVQTWRAVLGCWEKPMPFWSAARVWSVSNLGKYVPGKIWQIGAMSAMSRELGVSPIVASAAAILGAIVNVIAGFVLAILCGRVLLDRAQPGWGTLATVIVAISLVGLALAPFLVPRLAPLIARLAGRRLETTLPVRAVVYSLAGNVVAWLIYGAAFELLVIGLLGSASGGYPAYLAAYTISYLFGYLAFFAPAGAGVRELFMLQVLEGVGLATPQAALVTIVSRVWLTLLEVTPALLFWAHHRMRRRTTTIDSPDVPNRP